MRAMGAPVPTRRVGTGVGGGCVYRTSLVYCREREMEEKIIQERAVLSPLRYPGGKRRLMPYVAAALSANGLEPDLFVEPFAGGASVALELLATEKVRRIGSGGARSVPRGVLVNGLLRQRLALQEDRSD